MNSIKIIETNPTHHFPASYRNELLKNFTSTQTIYIILNTLYINLKIWEEKYKHDSSFYDTIKQILKYKDGEVDKKSFTVFINKQYTHAEDIISDGNFAQGYALLSLVKLGQEILSDSFTSEDELSAQSDPEQWGSLFYGSLAYNGGAEGLNKINTNLNKSYWLFFIENLKTDNRLINDINTPRTDVGVEKKRKQVENALTDISIANDLNDLKEKLVQQKDIHRWATLEVECYLVNNSYSLLGKNEDGKIDNMEMYKLGLAANVKAIFFSVRDKMYNLYKSEGAWFNMIVIINKDNVTKYDFAYDIKSPYLSNYVKDIDFKDDFKKYPRTEEFIPQWLNHILKT